MLAHGRMASAFMQDDADSSQWMWPKAQGEDWSLRVMQLTEEMDRKIDMLTRLVQQAEAEGDESNTHGDLNEQLRTCRKELKSLDLELAAILGDTNAQPLLGSPQPEEPQQPQDDSPPPSATIDPGPTTTPVPVIPVLHETKARRRLSTSPSPTPRRPSDPSTSNPNLRVYTGHEQAGISLSAPLRSHNPFMGPTPTRRTLSGQPLPALSLIWSEEMLPTCPSSQIAHTNNPPPKTRMVRSFASGPLLTTTTTTTKQIPASRLVAVHSAPTTQPHPIISALFPSTSHPPLAPTRSAPPGPQAPNSTDGVEMHTTTHIGRYLRVPSRQARKQRPGSRDTAPTWSPTVESVDEPQPASHTLAAFVANNGAAAIEAGLQQQQRMDEQNLVSKRATLANTGRGQPIQPRQSQMSHSSRTSAESAPPVGLYPGPSPPAPSMHPSSSRVPPRSQSLLVVRPLSNLSDLESRSDPQSSESVEEQKKKEAARPRGGMRTDPQQALGDKQMTTINSTWRQAMQRARPSDRYPVSTVAAHFYRRLCTQCPDMHHPYTLAFQTEVFAGLIRVLVPSINTSDYAHRKADLLALGRAHAQLGLTRAHYEAAYGALAHVVAARVGQMFDARAEEAWTEGARLAVDTLVTAQMLAERPQAQGKINTLLQRLKLKRQDKADGKDALQGAHLSLSAKQAGCIRMAFERALRRASEQEEPVAVLTSIFYEDLFARHMPLQLLLKDNLRLQSGYFATTVSLVVPDEHPPAWGPTLLPPQLLEANNVRSALDSLTVTMRRRLGSAFDHRTREAWLAGCALVAQEAGHGGSTRSLLN